MMCPNFNKSYTPFENSKVVALIEAPCITHGLVLGPKFRLQTGVLSLIDYITSLMSTSTPVATVFIDFRQASDHLWLEDCIGKLKRLCISKASYIQ